MTPALSSTGLVLHNLGLASAFGGSLFGQVALDPAVKVLSSKEERGKISNAAWKNYSPLNTLGIAATALTWWMGRSRLGGWEIDRATRSLVITKDILVGTCVALTVASTATGMYLKRQAPEGATPMESGGSVSYEASERIQKAHKAVNTLGTLNVICMAGIIGITAILNMKAGSSHKWAGLAKLLP
jgi:hypothetical protein